jgi:RNA polymerase sigma-70 factor (ECF subfamily)
MRRSSFIVARENPEKFREVYTTYYEPILGYFARRTFDADSAFDLMHETFTVALDKLDELRGSTEAEGRAWLFGIAKYELYHWYAQGETDRRCREKLGFERTEQSDSERAFAEELAELDTRRPEISARLALLSHEQAEAIRLRVIEERPYVEIAAILEITEQAVRLRVSRGLRRLARDLTAAHEEAT